MKKMLIKLLSFLLTNDIKLIKGDIKRLNNEKFSLEKKISQLKNEYTNEKFSLEKKISRLKDEYTTYEDYSEFGMPTKFYNFGTSQRYKEYMAEIVKEQKKMIKCDEAFWFNGSYTLNGSAKKGRDYLKNQAKLLLRAFNGECETLFNSINYNNITNIEVKIEKSFLQINKLGKDYNYIKVTNWKECKDIIDNV